MPTHIPYEFEFGSLAMTIGILGASTSIMLRRVGHMTMPYAFAAVGVMVVGLLMHDRAVVVHEHAETLSAMIAQHDAQLPEARLGKTKPSTPPAR